MSEHNPETPPRPDNWEMDYSECKNVTMLDGTIHNKLERDRRNLQDKWKAFREMFHSQQERELRPGNTFRPNLELIEWKELNKEM